MTKITKVAICFSGKIRQGHDVTKINMDFFKRLENNNPVRFDYYCHTWNPGTVYPYYFSKSIADAVGVITSDSNDDINEIIDIIKPIKAKTDPYYQLYNYYKKNKVYSEHYSKFNNWLLENQHCYINLKELDLHNFVIWAQSHNVFNRYIHHLSQFYSFEQSINLAKNNIHLRNSHHYDVVIKMRYDVLIDQDAENFLTTIYASENNNCIRISCFNLFYYPDTKNGTADLIKHVNNCCNKDMIFSESAHSYGVSDRMMIGGANSMYFLAYDLTQFLSDRIINIDNEPKVKTPRAEYFWALAAEKKNILIEADSSFPRTSIIRDFNDYKHKIPDQGKTVNDYFLMSHDERLADMFSKHQLSIDEIDNVYFKLKPQKDNDE